MLHIVGTPIGNLEDISLRQARILSTSEVILAEDTRSAGMLLKKITELFSFQINPSQRLISYYKDKEFEKLPEVIEILNSGISVSLISESGMPIISDPGGLLVQYCKVNAIPYTVIPGPSSITSAIALSGQILKSWTFIGFLPKKENDLARSIADMQSTLKLWKDHGIVAFESAERFGKTMVVFHSHFPHSTITVCREITKKFEEIVSRRPEELLQLKLRGELVLIIT